MLKKFSKWLVKMFLFDVYFRTISSFCAMFARDSSCGMSGKFVQSWWQQQPVIIKKLTGLKQKLPKNDAVQTKIHKTFSCIDCLQSFGQYIGFLALQCCPKSIKTIFNTIFLCNVAWS